MPPMGSAMPSSNIQKPAHKPKLGFFIYILASMAVIGSYLFGYGTGIVSDAMIYVARNKGMNPLDDLWHEIIVSCTMGAAGIGALIGGPLSDKFGRKKSIVISSITFTIGSIICAAAFNKWILLIGRLFVGFAIGISSMVVPVYVSEASPASIRGTLGVAFQLFLTFGLISANVIAGIFSYINPENIGWRFMFGLAAIPSAIQFIGFLFLPESPRFLYEHSGPEESKKVLKRIYNGDEEWIDYEMEEIKFSYDQQMKAKLEYGIDGFVIGRVLTTPHVRKALIIGCALQAFQQLCGINTVMYYSGTIFKSAGIINDHTNIWISCVTVGAKVMATFIPMYLIERMGRKSLLIISMIIVIISSVLLGGTFLLINKNTAKVITPKFADNWTNPDITDYSLCSGFSNCDYCVTNENCGFCTHQGDEMKQGYCLPVGKSKDTQSSTGYCENSTTSDTDNYHNISLGRYEWTHKYCHTSYTWLPILVIIIYISSFSAGYGPIPWVVNSEFYPLWARSTCASLATFTNWAFNLIVSLTFLSLTEAITKFGVFFLYAGLTVIALILFIIVVPETKGLNLEEIEMLFMSKEARLEKEEQLKMQHQQQRQESYISFNEKIKL